MSPVTDYLGLIFWKPPSSPPQLSLKNHGLLQILLPGKELCFLSLCVNEHRAPSRLTHAAANQSSLLCQNHARHMRWAARSTARARKTCPESKEFQVSCARKLPYAAQSQANCSLLWISDSPHVGGQRLTP